MSLIRRTAPILTLLAAATPLAAQTPGPLSAAKHVTARYELYAPTQQEVDSARPYVERAIEGFGRAFGEAAPKVAVVLFDSNPALAAFDVAPFARRGFATRKWLSDRAHASAERTTDLVAATPLGVVVGSAPGDAGVRVITALPDGAAVGLQGGDVIKSLNGTRVAKLIEFAGLFDALAVGAQAKLEVDRGGTVVQVAFAKNASSSLGRLARSPQQSRATRAGYGDVLTHETAHTLLDAYVQSKLGPPRGGAPVWHVPAWLHEAVAQLVEFPTAEARTPRRDVARELLGSHKPLAELFTMPHPVTSLLSGPGGSVRPVPGGNSVMVRPGSPPPGASGSPPNGGNSIMVPSGSPPPGASGGPVPGIFTIAAPTGANGGFYPQSLSVLEFLIARAGPEILPRLAVGLASGKTVGQVLAEAKAPLPADPAALEREWTAWMAAQPPAAQ